MLNRKNKFILFAFCVVMLFPVYSRYSDLFDVFRLHGVAAEQEPQMKYDVKMYFSGDFQLLAESRMKQTLGGRNFFIRVYNQLRFNLFGKTTAGNVVFGKNEYLFEKPYLDSYIGLDMLPEDSVKLRINQLEKIQATLENQGKTFVFVLGPSKCYYYPEYLPGEYLKKGKNVVRNYDRFTSALSSSKLNIIDFNKYFVTLKKHTKYPLFPQHGIHWSTYGACIASDSIIKFIEYKSKANLPDLTWNKVETGAPRDSDYDLGNLLNLLFQRKSLEMGYPKFLTESGDHFKQVKAVVIGDSFFWAIINVGFAHSFQSLQYRYYNHETFNIKSSTNENTLSEQIIQNDVVILMVNESNLRRIGWGSVEEMLTLKSDMNNK